MRVFVCAVSERQYVSKVIIYGWLYVQMGRKI